MLWIVFKLGYIFGLGASLGFFTSVLLTYFIIDLRDRIHEWFLPSPTKCRFGILELRV